MNISNLLNSDQYDKWKLDNNEQDNETYSIDYKFEGTETELDNFEKELEELLLKYNLNTKRS